jgi:uncharacterized protein YbgA (DUF1722 family)/uncharacterized protein YbbK (DUF523 family)
MESELNRSPVKPVVVCSRCLGFENCRYNGQMLNEPIAEALKPLVEFVVPCPEKDMGLGVPRHPVRIVQKHGSNRLVQLVTGEDVTAGMEGFIEEFFSRLHGVDGFILKSRSPSCGLFDVKHYPPGEKEPPLGRGSGLFGGEVLARYPGLAVEDEARLGNEKIRDHFLTKLFTLAEFRQVRGPGELVAFQSRHKLLLMAYSQKEMRELGRIVAHQNETGLERALDDYRSHLTAALAKGPSYRAHVNVLQHAFGYVSRQLSPEERLFFLDSLEMFREDRVPLLTLLKLLTSWVIRFRVEYLRDQSYFSPYPVQLQKSFDRYRSKDYWGR